MTQRKSGGGSSRKPATKKPAGAEDEAAVDNTEGGIYGPDYEGDEDLEVVSPFRHPADWEKEYGVGDSVGTGDFTPRQLQELKEAGVVRAKQEEPTKATKK